MQKLYFIHIRKTAGTSMRFFLANKLADDDICPILSERHLRKEFKGKSDNEITEYLENYTLISGHFANVNSLFREPRFSFTLLREPIHRTISEVNQMRSDKRDKLYEKAEGKTVNELLRDSAFDEPLRNRQTRILVHSAGKNYEDLSDEERLVTAKQYLDSLDFFGITELFDVSLEMFCHLLGWNAPSQSFTANTSMTKSGSKKDSLKMEEIALLYEANRLDIALYDYALDQFDKRFLKPIAKKQRDTIQLKQNYITEYGDTAKNRIADLQQQHSQLKNQKDAIQNELVAISDELENSTVWKYRNKLRNLRNRLFRK